MAKIVMATHNHYEQIYKVGDRHIADAFTKMGHDVLYISGPFNIFRMRHLFQQRELRAMHMNIFKTWMKGGIRRNDRLLEYCPLSLLPISNRLPFGKSKLALFKNTTLTFPSLSKYIHKRDFGKPDLLLVSQLQLAELFDCVDAKVKILRLTDEIAKFESVPDEILLLEKWAVEKADHVLVTSSPLQERLKSFREDVKYLPNAVDYDFYHSADRTVPPEYMRIEGPKVVYIGAMEYWFDVGLVGFLADLNPEVNFILIGNPQIDVSELQSIKNICFTGPKPYVELPGYLWNADVGIIPFKKMPLIEAVSPLKLYEYMACRLPVVSTRWKELERIDSPALLADTYEDFAGKLACALATEQDENLANLCQDFVKNNSWEGRAREILRLADLGSVTQHCDTRGEYR